MFKALLCLFLVGSVARAAPLAEEIEFYEKLVNNGDWNERVYAVNQLGQKGADGKKGIQRAVKDPDWQIRLNAVHWLGRLRFGDREMFEGIARSEACPWVRMAALHWLGRAGGEDPLKSANRVRENSKSCRTWSWSAKEGLGRKTAKRSETIASTSIDDKGCQYVQFQKKRGRVCPGNTILRGVGMAPYKTKLGLGRAKDSGVALCCPGDPGEGPVAAATGRPVQVECRLVPEDCPKGWTILESTKARPWEHPDTKFRRTHSHRLGDLNWVPCCRPHSMDAQDGEEEVELQESAPVAAAPRSSRNYLAEEEEYKRQEEIAAAAAEEEEHAPEEIDFDERVIARKLLGRRGKRDSEPTSFPEEKIERVANTDRVSEINALIDSIEEELSAVEAIPSRSDPDVEAEAERLGVSREEARLALATGARLPAYKQRLSAPEGPGGRDDIFVEGEARRLKPPEDELPSKRIQRMNRELGEAESRLGGPDGPGARSERKTRGRLTVEDDHGRPSPKHNALPALLRRLKSKDQRARARAAEALGALGASGKPAIDLLRKALRDRSPRVRANAAIALGNLTRGSDEAVKSLARLLKDKHPDVRYSAAQALGRIGTPSASRAFHKSMRSGMRIFLGTKN